MKTGKDRSMYFPPPLIRAVREVAAKPLSLITAGSGFGKTTAIATCMEKWETEGTLCRWYTCFGEAPENAWQGICRLIAGVDAQTGDYLSKIELPTQNYMGYISTLMGELRCERECALIIDNFQFANFPAPYTLINALAMHRCDKLHLVILTHPLSAEDRLAASNPRVYSVPQQLFCFSASDILKYFSCNGAILSGEQASRLCIETEGWIAAISLHLDEFLATGKLSLSLGISELIELSFWQRLDERQKKLFLGISLLDTFTEAQAARMLGREVMQDELWSSVYGNAFVRKIDGGYTLHNLLKSFLAAKFKAQPESVCSSMYIRAGEASQAQGNRILAIRFFMQANADLKALAVPLSSVELAELVRTQTAPFQALLARCRAEVLADSWLMLLGTAVKAGLNGKAQLAATALSRLRQLRDMPDSGEEEKRCAAAALEMAASFRAYNDIAEMGRHHEATIALLQDPQDFYVTNDSWTFCIPSVVYMFWRESGTLKQSISLMEKHIRQYAVLGGGKGLGSSEMMEAEATLLAGNVEESITKAYLTKAIAQKAEQDSILFCVYTLLARAALLNADPRAFEKAIGEIKQHAFRGKEFLCVTTSEAALGFVYSLLDMWDDIPMWLLSAETVRETLYPVSTPFALIVTLRYIRSHAPEELLGTAQAYIREAQEQHHLLPQLYFLLEEAVWYQQQQQQQRAAEQVRLALSLALPDNVLLPFAEYYALLAAVLDEAALALGGDAVRRQLSALGRSFGNGVAAVRAAMGGTSPLTPREREVALLAQKNTPTKKIAEQLCISPATVKNTLSKVYSKLGIGGKTELENIQI